MYEKLVPLTTDDAIIEAKQTQSFATISDQLSVIEGEMREWTASTSDPRYQKMIGDRAALLQKLPKKA